MITSADQRHDYGSGTLVYFYTLYESLDHSKFTSQLDDILNHVRGKLILIGISEGHFVIIFK